MTRPDASGWTYTPPPPAGPAKEPRSGVERLLMAAIALVVAVVGIYVVMNSNAGFAPAASQSTNSGRILFGSDYNATTFAIVGEVTQFPLSTKQIAWAAHFREPAGTTKLTLVLASVVGAAEQIIDSADVDISNPSFDVLANKGDLAGVVGGKAGTYVLRYLRGSTILAEGRFTLA